MHEYVFNDDHKGVLIVKADNFIHSLVQWSSSFLLSCLSLNQSLLIYLLNCYILCLAVAVNSSVTDPLFKISVRFDVETLISALPQIQYVSVKISGSDENISWKPSGWSLQSEWRGKFVQLLRVQVLYTCVSNTFYWRRFSRFRHFLRCWLNLRSFIILIRMIVKSYLMQL